MQVNISYTIHGSYWEYLPDVICVSYVLHTVSVSLIASITTLLDSGIIFQVKSQSYIEERLRIQFRMEGFCWLWSGSTNCQVLVWLFWIPILSSGALNQWFFGAIWKEWKIWSFYRKARSTSGSIPCKRQMFVWKLTADYPLGHLIMDWSIMDWSWLIRIVSGHFCMPLPLRKNAKGKGLFCLGRRCCYIGAPCMKHEGTFTDI